MDKKEQRLRNINLGPLLTGVSLALGLLILEQGGINGFRQMNWSSISVLQWVTVTLLFVLSVVVQYFLLLLLRYSFLKYLVLGVIPALWLFNNGIVAMDQFLGWTTETGKTMGWFSISDLIGWLIGIIFSPVLIATGAIENIFDSTGSTLTQACFYARLAVDVAGILPTQFIDYGLNILSVVWDLISKSFIQEVWKSREVNNTLFELNGTAVFGVARFMQNLGYSLFCLWG